MKSMRWFTELSPIGLLPLNMGSQTSYLIKNTRCFTLTQFKLHGNNSQKTQVYYNKILTDVNTCLVNVNTAPSPQKKEVCVWGGAGLEILIARSSNMHWTLLFILWLRWPLHMVSSITWAPNFFRTFLDVIKFHTKQCI